MTASDYLMWGWIILSCPIGMLAGMFVAAQDRESWIESPGFCPVPPDTRVDVMLPADLVIKNVVAGNWIWIIDRAMLSEKLTIKFWRVAT